MPSNKQKTGNINENRAESYLVAHGYLILESNWRRGGVEIDRVALDGEVLVFVEVRSRTSLLHGSPAETVGPKKQRQLVRGATLYLQSLGRVSNPSIRFDVVSVSPSGVELIKDAFGVEENPSGRSIWML